MATARAVSVIPAGGPVATLPFPAESAIVGDVDGDGIRELVQIGPRAQNPAHHAVAVTSLTTTGTATSHGQAVITRGVAPATEETPGVQPDEGFIPVGVGDAARALAWRLEGEERVLAVAVGVEREGRACCLTIHRVALHDGSTSLELLSDAQLSADGIAVVDFDGDGTDELFVVEPPSAAAPGRTLFSVLQWDGSGFTRLVADDVQGDGRSELHVLDNSDGIDGDEIALSTRIQLDGPNIILHRIALDAERQLRKDEHELSDAATPLSVEGPHGPLVALVAFDAGLDLISWPAGGTPTRVSESPRRGLPLGSLGSGDGARLYFVSGAGLSTLSTLDAGLVPGPRVAASAAAAHFVRDGQEAPYVGPLPGGLPDGRAAIIFHGQLVADPGRDPGSPFTADALTIASLPGRTPIGVLGPDRGWIGLAHSDRFDAAGHGGPLLPLREPGVAIRLAPATDVLAPEIDGGSISPELQGAVPDARDPGRSVLVAAGRFELRVHAPPGSIARVWSDTAAVEQAAIEVGASGSVVLPIGPAPASFNLPARFGLRLEVITADGHGYVASYQVGIEMEPPEIQVDTPFAPLGPDVTISGGTEPGATVSIDGRSVPVAADGTFAATVPAGLVPRDVRVDVTDQVGNAASTSVSVVTPVDYRRLPWIPIVGILTLLLTGILYLRAPRPVRAPARAAGEGTFEEID